MGSKGVCPFHPQHKENPESPNASTTLNLPRATRGPNIFHLELGQLCGHQFPQTFWRAWTSITQGANKKVFCFEVSRPHSQKTLVPKGVLRLRCCLRCRGFCGNFTGAAATRIRGAPRIGLLFGTPTSDFWRWPKSALGLAVGKRGVARCGCAPRAFLRAIARIVAQGFPFFPQSGPDEITPETLPEARCQIAFFQTDGNTVSLSPILLAARAMPLNDPTFWNSLSFAFPLGMGRFAPLAFSLREVETCPKVPLNFGPLPNLCATPNPHATASSPPPPSSFTSRAKGVAKHPPQCPDRQSKCLKKSC